MVRRSVVSTEGADNPFGTAGRQPGPSGGNRRTKVQCIRRESPDHDAIAHASWPTEIDAVRRCCQRMNGNVGIAICVEPPPGKTPPCTPLEAGVNSFARSPPWLMPRRGGSLVIRPTVLAAILGA